MSERRGVAVIIRTVCEWLDGEERTTYYGPFLPHAGSSVDRVIDRLHIEAEQNPKVTAIDCYVEHVFIGESESDAAVVAVR